MKRVSVVLLLIATLFHVFGCSNNSENIDISKWDLNAIGYYNGWDDSISENYSIGIIDIDTKVKSDDKEVEIDHVELLKAIVLRLSDKCSTDVILLSNTPSNDELDDAILTMINKGKRVINISLGTSLEFDFSEEVKRKIVEDNIFVICAGGNNTDDLLYPALCSESISVISCDIYGQVNKEMEKVDKISFTMPGQHINICDSYFSGSSLSAVYLSVLSAAYVTKHPEITTFELINLLQNCCEQSNEYSYGVVQIDKLFG